MKPLNPYNFGHRDPEPKEEDYHHLIWTGGPVPEPSHDEFDSLGFEKALDSWKAKNVEPEPEWVSFMDSFPKEGQFVYEAKVLRRKLNRIVGNGVYWKEFYERNYNLTNFYWADKETHDQKLAYYHEHQTKFEGWKEIDSQDHLTFSKNGHEVSFWKTSAHRFWILKHNAAHITYNGEIPDETTFRSICEINGIEV